MERTGTRVETATGAPDERLARNLAALDRVDPELAERLRLPVEGGHVRVAGDGALELRLHRSWISLRWTGPDLDRGLSDAAGATNVLVLGLGGGEAALELLAVPSSPLVTVWERDPWLLRLFLARHDVAQAILDRRLSLSLGTDLLAHRGWRGARVVHPVLGRHYAGEIAWLDDEEVRPCAAVLSGGLFVEPVRRALAARGYALWTLEVTTQAEEESSRTLRRLRPELVLSINHVEGLAEFVRRHGAKLVVWEIDAATAPPCAAPRPNDHAFLFTHRRANVAEFRAAGYEHVAYLPLGADPESRSSIELDPGERERLSAPFAFVGSSLVENALACRKRFVAAVRAWDAKATDAEGEALLESVLAGQRRDPTRFLVPELLDRAAPGYRCDSATAEDPAMLAGEVAASEKRLSWAANLREAGLAVWGDAGWGLAARHGVDYRGPAGHAHELTRIYNACPLHWDVGRLYQSDIVTMRVFDVLACGRLVLAEHSPALEELFDVGVEVESYRDLAELRAKVARFQAHPDQAERIAARGRDAVRERHTIARRVETLLEAAGLG